ncbi:MAG: hypothetical protein LBP59_13700 [Planctomycetaceae bacterium]|jgi:hypothetical protein|nr:hypothetical protein [Planctomycetaceae bacterium]
MTSKQLKQQIIEKYPNGFSFEPNALRLVEGKIGYQPDQSDLDEIKKEMFKRQDGVYLFCEQVADKETRDEIENTAEAWIKSFGCFSLDALRDKYNLRVRNLSNKIEDFEAFLGKLHYPLEAYQSAWFMPHKDKTRFTRPVDVRREVVVAKLTQNIDKIIEEKSCAADYEIIENIPALNKELLTAVIKENMPNIIATINNDTMCFQLAENHLPDNLSEKIREAIDKLETANLKITQEALHIVLSLLYKTNFNETYSLPDMRTFRNVIEQHYNNAANRIWKNNIFIISPDKE